MGGDSKPAAPLRIAVLGSGKGSNCQSIIDAIEDGSLAAKIVCVISDVEDAYILERARAHGLPARYISAGASKTKLDGDGEQEYIKVLKEAETDVVVLAGFMRILTPKFMQDWQGRIINIHPSLLPNHRGLRTHERALAAGDTEHGCTVHEATGALDDGPILGQARLSILRGDTPAILAARVLELEHALYPAVLRRFASGTREPVFLP